MSASEKRLVGVLFVAALAVRLLYLAEARDTPFFDHPRLDALFHDAWARSIASGNFWGDEVFFRAPLYPYLLASLYKLFGHSFLIPRLVQHLLGSAVVVVVYFLARRLFGKPSAVIASVLVCCYGVLVSFEGELLFESFLTFLCAVWALLFVRALESGTPRHWALAGLTYGFVCITRPTFVAVAVPLALVILLSGARADGWRHRVLLTASFLAAMGLPITPVTVRNYLVGGDAVLIASQGGINFYIGNNERADGVSSSMPGVQGVLWENAERAAYVESVLGTRPSPSEESRFWYAKGLAFLRDRPGDAVLLWVKKAYLFWNNVEIPNNRSFYSIREASLLLKLLPVGFWLVGPLGLCGMILAWGNRDARGLVVFVMAVFLVTIAFFVCDRYRLPVVPLLCVFGARVLVDIAGDARGGDRGRLARNVALLGAAAFFVNSELYPIERVDHAQELLRRGLVALSSGDYEAARRDCEQALVHRPGLPNARLVLGAAAWMQGDRETAKHEFLAVLAANPGSYGALVNLSRLYLEEGQADSAMLLGYRAIAARSRVPAGYAATALALQLRGNPEQAESVLYAGLEKCGPGFLSGETMLGDIAFAKGDLEVAAARYRRALQGLGRTGQPQYEAEFGFSDEAWMGESKAVVGSNACIGLGRVYATRGQLDSAAAKLRMAVRWDSANADAWTNLGLVLMRQGSDGESERALRTAVAIDGEEHLYWYNLGVFLGNAGRLAEARGAFERALELRPDARPAKEKLAITLELLKR